MWEDDDMEGFAELHQCGEGEEGSSGRCYQSKVSERGRAVWLHQYAKGLERWCAFNHYAGDVEE